MSAGRSGAVAVLTCAAALAVATVATAADRALLVGIDTYSDPRVPDTPGAVADARAMADLVVDAFRFEPSAVRLLLDGEATAARVLEEFSSWLVEDSAPGDRVFFYYAGHGSQLEDDGGDEDDGFDETLAPFDVDPATGGNEIRDDTLDRLIAQLSGRRAVLLFDSCHSGTLTRGLPRLGEFPQGGGARYLPRPDQFQAIWEEAGNYRTAAGSAGYALEADRSPGDKSVLDGPGAYGRLSGIVAISAAAPGQLAWPVRVGDTYRGAMTYVFEQLYRDTSFSRGLLDDLASEAIDTVGSGVEKTAAGMVTGSTGSVSDAAEDVAESLTVGALETAIGQGVDSLRDEGRLQGDQEPWFEVISEYPIHQEPLFGDWEQAPAVALTNPISSREVALATAGQRSLYYDGEAIEFEVTTDSGGHLYLLVFSEGEQATCIFPNRDDPDNRIRAGTTRLPSTDRYAFPVGEPYGRDLVVALVADGELPLCDRIDYSWDEVFEQVELPKVQEMLKERSKRGLRVESLSDGEAAEDVPSWQTASLALEARPRGEP